MGTVCRFIKPPQARGRRYSTEIEVAPAFVNDWLETARTETVDGGVIFEPLDLHLESAKYTLVSRPDTVRRFVTTHPWINKDGDGGPTLGSLADVILATGALRSLQGQDDEDL